MLLRFLKGKIMANKKEKNLSANEVLVNKTEGWISTHKNLIIYSCIAVVAIIIIAMVITFVSGNGSSSLDTELATLETGYSEYKVMDADAEGYDEKLETVKSSADALVTEAGLTKYAGAKAEIILAEIDYAEGNYADAADKYEAVYQAQKSTYLGQVALYSKAVAVEESGDKTGALDLYNRVFSEYGTEGLYASRALFNAARLTEESDKALAISIYEQLVGEFEESSSEYAKLAKSRISQLNAAN